MSALCATQRPTPLLRLLLGASWSAAALGEQRAGEKCVNAALFESEEGRLASSAQRRGESHSGGGGGGVAQLSKLQFI